MASVTEFLEQRLKLKVNRQKSTVGQVRERKFLGHRLLVDWNRPVPSRHAGWCDRGGSASLPPISIPGALTAKKGGLRLEDRPDPCLVIQVPFHRFPDALFKAVGGHP